jgi:hypothetical protein
MQYKAKHTVIQKNNVLTVDAASAGLISPMSQSAHDTDPMDIDQELQMKGH